MMSSTKNTAERIRPILQAMERSIESVRRQRLRMSEPMRAAAPAAPMAQPSRTPMIEQSSQPHAPVRLKARPKRP